MAGTPDCHSFLDLVCRSEQHGSYIVFFEVHDDCPDTVFKFQEFVGFGIVHTVDSHYAVTYLQHFSDFLELEVRIYFLQLPEQYV